MKIITKTGEEERVDPRFAELVQKTARSFPRKNNEAVRFRKPHPFQVGRMSLEEDQINGR